MSEYTREQLRQWAHDIGTKLAVPQLVEIAEHLDTRDARPAFALTLYEQVEELMELAKKKGKVLEWNWRRGWSFDVVCSAACWSEGRDFMLTGWLATWLYEQGRNPPRRVNGTWQGFNSEVMKPDSVLHAHIIEVGRYLTSIDSQET